MEWKKIYDRYEINTITGEVRLASTMRLLKVKTVGNHQYYLINGKTHNRAKLLNEITYVPPSATENTACYENYFTNKYRKTIQQIIAGYNLTLLDSSELSILWPYKPTLVTSGTLSLLLLKTLLHRRTQGLDLLYKPEKQVYYQIIEEIRKEMLIESIKSDTYINRYE